MRWVVLLQVVTIRKGIQDYLEVFKKWVSQNFLIIYNIIAKRKDVYIHALGIRKVSEQFLQIL